MRTGLYLLLLGCGLILQPVMAGELTIPGHSLNGQKQVMPKRGISMEKVLSKFGEPDPPITEWVYGSFRVYFEYQTVLHSIDLNTLIMPKN